MTGQPNNEVAQPRVFFGWWIVLAASTVTAVSATFGYYGFGIFFNPIREHFGWSAAVLGGALSLSRLEGGALAPVIGYLVDRIGPRKLMLIGVVASGAGYILLSQTTSLVYFYIVFLTLVHGGASAGMGNPPRVAVANWFQRKRGTALGLVTLGLSIGGLFAKPLADFITSFGWRNALIVAGLLIWAVGIPASLVMRQRPEQYGYLPDGRIPDPAPVAETSAVADTTPPADQPKSDSGYEEVNFSPKQALRTLAFWSITLTFTARNLVTGSVALFLVPLLQERGMSLSEGATIVSLMALLGMPGRVGFGWLGDHFDKRWIIAFCFVLQSAGLILFTSLEGNLGIFFFLALYAPTYAGVNPLIPALQGDYFGRQWFGTIRGLMAPISTFALVSSPFLFTLIHDWSGSYEPAFVVLAVANVLALVFIVITRKPKDPIFAASGS